MYKSRYIKKNEAKEMQSLSKTREFAAKIIDYYKSQFANAAVAIRRSFHVRPTAGSALTLIATRSFAQITSWRSRNGRMREGVTAS